MFPAILVINCTRITYSTNTVPHARIIILSKRDPFNYPQRPTVTPNKQWAFHARLHRRRKVYNIGGAKV